MENRTFWNDAARWGIGIGALLAASFIIEEQMTNSGRLVVYSLMLVEWIVVAALHFWLLLRFTRSRAALCSKEEGFTFGQGYGSVMGVSIFSGIILGVVQTVYLHLIIGYDRYIERTIASMSAILKSGTQLPKSFEGIFAEMFQQLKSAPHPSVLQSVWGGVFSALLFGAVFGLLIAAITARPPRPFETPKQDSANDATTE